MRVVGGSILSFDVEPVRLDGCELAGIETGYSPCDGSFACGFSGDNPFDRDDPDVASFCGFPPR